MQTILTQLPAALFETPDVVRAIADASDRLMRTSDDALVLGEYWFGLHFTLSGETPFPSTEARRQGVVALAENDIPPAGWDDPEMWDGLLKEFRALREFYTSCHAAAAGVLLRVVTT